MKRLEDLVLALGAEMQRAQQACERLWPGTQVAGMTWVMDACVEPLGSAGSYGLRIGSPPTRKQPTHQLSIEVPGYGVEAIVVRVDGQLLAIYRRPGNEQAQ